MKRGSRGSSSSVRRIATPRIHELDSGRAEREGTKRALVVELLSREQRERVLKKLQTGASDLVVATDVYSRILDFDDPNVGVGCGNVHIFDPAEHEGSVVAFRSTAPVMRVVDAVGSGVRSST